MNNVDAKSEEIKQPFAMMTINNLIFKVLLSLLPPTTTIPDFISPHSCDENAKQGIRNERAQIDGSWSGGDSAIFHTTTNNKSNLLTLIDSAATDHYFADRSLFKSYTQLIQTSTRLAAGDKNTFEVVGKGTMEFNTIINEVNRNISLNNILHTLSLRSNLIFVSKLGEKEANVFFYKDKAIVKLQDGTEIISAVKIR